MATIAAPSDRYLALIREFPLRPIRSEDELDAAIAMLNKLIDKGCRGERDQQEEDYMLVLADLVHQYEAKTDPIPDINPVDAIRFMMGEHGLTQTQLAEETGIATTTLSEILHGKRNISPKVRAALAKRFNVDPSMF